MEPTVINADNKTLQPYVNQYGTLVGHIDEVNGLEATEVPFTPTREELLLIAKDRALLILKLTFAGFIQGDYDGGWYPKWRKRFAERRLIRAENLLGADVVRRALEGVEDDFRRSVPMTLREWDIFKHGTEHERVELRNELIPMTENIQAQFDPWARQQEDIEQEMDMQEWREQHQAARDEEKTARAAPDKEWQEARDQSERQIKRNHDDLFSDRFMAQFVANAEEAAAEPDERAKARQMATLGASILSRLATSELLESDTQEQASMLAIRLVVNLHLEIQ